MRKREKEALLKAWREFEDAVVIVREITKRDEEWARAFNAMLARSGYHIIKM